MNPNGNPLTLKKFSSDYQPKKNGRKPSKLKKYIKENNLSAVDIKLILGKFYDLPKEKLFELVKDDSTPILISGIASGLLQDMKRGTTYTIQWLIDRGYGKAIERIEVESRSEDITDLSHEARAAEIDKLLAKRNLKIEDKTVEKDRD